MNATEKKAALTAQLEALVDDVKAGDEEAMTKADDLVAELAEVDELIEKADEKAATIAALGQTSAQAPKKGIEMDEKKTFVDVAEATVAAIKDAGLERGIKGGKVAAEVKAATDTVVSPNPGDVQIQDRVVAGRYVSMSAVEALFPVENVSAPTIGYYRITTEGTANTVAENGAKPQMSAAATLVTVGLKKIAAIMKVTDEFIEDYPRLVSAIRGRLHNAKKIAVENQLINGNGSGANLTGLLNAGISTATYAATATAQDKADGIYAAAMKIKEDTGYDADGVILNPADMQALRLAKDGNLQYFGGGFFQNEYGNGEARELYPAIWGLRVAVSSQITAGTIVVGAFRTEAAIARKGGERVEVGYDGEDFSHDRVTLRGEERLALEVFDPKGFVRLTAAAK